MIARLASLPAPCSSGRLQSQTQKELPPSLRYGDAHLHCTTPFGQAVRCKCRETRCHRPPRVRPHEVSVAQRSGREGHLRVNYNSEGHCGFKITFPIPLSLLMKTSIYCQLMAASTDPEKIIN